jgi:glucose-6-phosphate dehydrogenase assembly protein OpcA
MRVDLTGTSSARVNAALLDTRRRAGSPTVGMVLTLVVVTDDEHDQGWHDAVVEAATQSAREHPSRILIVSPDPAAAEPRLDAEVCGAGERGPGETVTLSLHGELAAHPASVVLPLLVPDTPVVVYWPGRAPAVPATDPLGALAQRRITDLAASPDPRADLAQRARGYRPGDTDLSWTRITPWRSLLAAALDQPHADVTGAHVAGEPDSPSTELLALWLEDRLGVSAERATSDGPGITEARLTTADGDIAVTRPDGRLALLTQPGWPERPVALKRRPLVELMAEELRRLDADDVYAATLTRVAGTAEEARR